MMMHAPMRRESCARAIMRHEGGAALLIALVLLLAVLIVGVSAARTALDTEKSARNMRDRLIAFQAAEAALADAERDIEGSGGDPARAALFAAGSAIGFEDGCARGANNANLGLCLRTPPGLVPAWLAADLASGDSAAVPYGKFTGAAMPVGSGPLPALAPRYIIELMPLARAGEDAGDRAANVYRITSIGFGTRTSTRVVLQAFYRKVAAGGGA